MTQAQAERVAAVGQADSYDLDVSQGDRSGSRGTSE